MSKQDHTQADLRRLERDNKTVMAMAQIYCRGHNHIKERNEALCTQCKEIIDYAFAKTYACPHKHKGTCDTCSIQCYKPEMRQKIREVMAFSGPRMIFHHPIMAIQHLIRKQNEKRNSEHHR